MSVGFTWVSFSAKALRRPVAAHNGGETEPVFNIYNYRPNINADAGVQRARITAALTVNSEPKL
jgi:hypothetical protein